MKIIKMEKSLLVLEVGLNRTYLAGLAYLFFGLFVLAVSSLKHSDNMPVIILSIITICISFLFLLLAGKKEIEINKNSSQITINYYRNLYNKQKQVWINDVEQIMYKVRSGRGLDGRYDYYLKTKSGQSFFLSSIGFSIASMIMSSVNKEKIKTIHPQAIKHIAKFLNIEIIKKKGFYF